MRESNWHKRIISFKRRVVSALARTATVTAGKQQTNQGLPASRSRLPAQRAEIGGSPASCHPAVVGPDGPQADDEPRIENTGLQGLLPASTADGTPTKEPPPDPVAPVSGAEAKDYWLMDTQRLTLDSLPRPTLYWDAARIGLLEYLPAAAAEDCQRLLTIADSENVISPVTDTLRYAGIVKKNGEFRRSVARGLKIVHTGDMILKHRPNPAAVEYWLNVEKQLERLDGELILLAGNHELEIWDCLQRGQRLGMKRRQAEQTETFIRRCKLFHVSGSVMFIHGYPTLNLLRRLKRFQEHTGLSIDGYNEACFQPALDDPSELSHYRYLRGKGTRKLLLHDLENPASYYRMHGREIASLLRNFGIEQVVHGHRPERSGVQADYEFRHWLPDIRMIGNDTQLRQRGLGALVMRTESEEGVEVLLVNTRTAGNEQRKLVKRLLRNSAAEQPGAAELAASHMAKALTTRRNWDKRAEIPTS